MTDLFTRIKAEVPPENYRLQTAEGRAAWDSDLRDWISRKARDPSVKLHLSKMVKDWRWQVIEPLQRARGPLVELAAIGVPKSIATDIAWLQKNRAALDCLLRGAQE